MPAADRRDGPPPGRAHTADDPIPAPADSRRRARLREPRAGWKRGPDRPCPRRPSTPL